VSRIDVYQSVTDRVIEALEAGTVPWHKPWKGGGPQNVRNGRAYRGINVFLLEMQPYGDPRWGTFKAIKESGGNVRKGEKATWVVLWKRAQKSKAKMAEDPEQDAHYYMLRYFSVFNVEQCDGFEPFEWEHDHEPIERAQEIVDGYHGPAITYGGSRAAYSPLMDTVMCPELNQFDAPEDFYSTLYHELVHSTGHESRLARIESATFGTDPYAREELVAEMGAAMLSGLAGLATAGGTNTAAYIANWLGRLRDDHKLVVTAAAQAQRAADLILGTTFEEQSDEAATVAVAA
jgi:antirestriction protein ArdC